MNKALIEKAKKHCECSQCDNGTCEIYDTQGTGACTEYKHFIAGATWQREQLEIEIKEQQHFISLLAKYLEKGWQGLKCPYSDRCPCESEAWDCDVLGRGKWLTEVRSILDGKGKQYLAKLDLLEGDKK